MTSTRGRVRRLHAEYTPLLALLAIPMSLGAIMGVLFARLTTDPTAAIIGAFVLAIALAVAVYRRLTRGMRGGRG